MSFGPDFVLDFVWVSVPCLGLCRSFCLGFVSGVPDFVSVSIVPVPGGACCWYSLAGFELASSLGFCPGSDLILSQFVWCLRLRPRY